MEVSGRGSFRSVGVGEGIEIGEENSRVAIWTEGNISAANVLV